MLPYNKNVVTFRVLFSGYEAALRRYDEATRSQDAAVTFMPLFEALNWVVALDDWVSKHYAPEGKALKWAWRERVEDGHLFPAVRWARNRVHHQWADALTLSSGFSAPLVAPLLAHEWRWRAVDEIPPGDPITNKARAATDAEARASFQLSLAGQPARVVLHQVRTPLRSLASLLEPVFGSSDSPAETSGVGKQVAGLNRELLGETDE